MAVQNKKVSCNQGCGVGGLWVESDS